ncbi:hypothetical protein VTP01DRAFT_10302 [Rhizomucor pusillus]|uniref:uncharacterized protein n=1 Tax=Rhizomucor pusillus TaxID=4840 RepID=UPI003743A68A
MLYTVPDLPRLSRAASGTKCGSPAKAAGHVARINRHKSNRKPKISKLLVRAFETNRDAYEFYDKYKRTTFMVHDMILSIHEP